MPSAVQKRSYGSVKVFWLDKKFLKERLKESARRLIGEKADVEKVMLFGSLAADRATAFSDVDILIVVFSSDKRFIDRPDEFRQYFEGAGLSVDLFVYTHEEITLNMSFAEKALSGAECLAAGQSRQR